MASNAKALGIALVSGLLVGRAGFMVELAAVDAGTGAQGGARGEGL